MSRTYLGAVVADFTLDDGRVGLVRIELWCIDGARRFGRVLEVLS